MQAQSVQLPGLLCASRVAKRAGVGGAWTRLRLRWGDQSDRAGVQAPGDPRWKTPIGPGQAGETFREASTRVLQNRFLVLTGRNELAREQVGKESDRSQRGGRGVQAFSRVLLVHRTVHLLAKLVLERNWEGSSSSQKARDKQALGQVNPVFSGWTASVAAQAGRDPVKPLKPVRLRKRKMPNEGRCSFSCS